jgi:Bacteriodetes cell division protein (FtsL-like)
MKWIQDFKAQLPEINSWTQLINYIGTRGIVHNIKFIGYCVVLVLLYITIVHRNENQLRNITKASKKLKELGWEYKAVKSKYMFLTKESELAKSAIQQGLLVNVEVPKRIIINQKPIQK